MDEAKIRAIASDEATKVYQKLGSRFGVNQVPTHSHNNVDSPNVPAMSVQGFNQLSAQGNGVLSSTNIGERIVFWNQSRIDAGGLTTPLGTQSIFPSFPLVIINGDLEGESLDFAGGDAPDGTLLIYKTGDTYQLWFRIFGSWRGMEIGTPGLSTLNLVA